ncbi:hypothetical protein BDV96DRAFT_617858 [Lophiotrema nucula]|uniref:ClpP/crotonase-like domain-containing protein n=1 Tax=Lophiotrema nucula TaxID=690887 RepID=A0A6A5YDE4_9PLEO|nr:hypothetical protein BDV96DRAFT_617858 [Lophiotrema nucula]
MQKPPENRITVEFAQTQIRAYRDIEKELGSDAKGAVILRGKGAKFFTTGLDLDEREVNPFASTDGFYPVPCVLTLAHDYRIMNSRRGFWSIPPVNLGLHVNGMGAIIRSKATSPVARKILLEAHKFTGKEALEAGIVDAIADPGQSKMGVYGVLRNELVEEAAGKFKAISYVHHKAVSRQPRVKL